MSGGDMYDRISLMSIDFSKAVRIPECIDDSTWLSLDTESLVDTLDLNLQNDKYRKQQDPIYNNPSKPFTIGLFLGAFNRFSDYFFEKLLFSSSDKKRKQLLSKFEINNQSLSNDEVKFRLADVDSKANVQSYTAVKSPMKPSNTFLNTTNRIQPTIVEKGRSREKESKLPQCTSIRTRSVSRNALNRFAIKQPPLVHETVEKTPQKTPSPKMSFFSKLTSYKSSSNNNSSSKSKNAPKKYSDVDKAKIDEINIVAKKQEMALMEELCKARERIAIAQNNDFSRPTSSASNANNNTNFHNKSMEYINTIDREQNNNLDDCMLSERNYTPCGRSRIPLKTGIPVSSKLSIVKTPFRAFSSFRSRESSTTPLSSRDNSFTGINCNTPTHGKTTNREYGGKGDHPLYRSSCSSSTSSSLTKASSGSPMSQSGYALSSGVNTSSLLSKNAPKQQLSVDDRWIDECF
uniref:TPX2 domain-containing protein n=1 Tax=Strongyloides papillosus TaxID=174720 RepID=A0A0N5BSF0_STREA